MKKLRLLLVLCAGVVSASCSFGQQVKGDHELGLNGTFTVPHSSPSDADGTAQISYGYYFRRTDLLGFDLAVFVQKGSQAVYPQGRYRHLFSRKDAKVYPFVGAQAGGLLMRTGGSSTGNFLGAGEAGFKIFVSQRTALEIAYNLQYIQYSGGSFKDDSQSVITVGFTHIFGGHAR